MSESVENSQIDKLQKSLYSRGAPDIRTRRRLHFDDVEDTVKHDWGTPPPEDTKSVLTESYEDHSMSFFTKLLIGSAIFCVLAVGIGAYLVLNGANLISADNIDISISGPVSVPGGAPVSFDIRVTNKNNVDLVLADMSVDFPAGTVESADPTKELNIYRELIGDISAGQSAVKTVKAAIFGEENVQKQIVVTVTYKIKGSSSLFSKKKSYDILINSSPLVLKVSSFKEITAGQEADITATLESRSPDVLKNVLLEASYPFGFTFVSSNIKPISGNTVWKIGDILPGTSRTIAIRGKISGEDGDIKVFRFAAGAQNPRNTSDIATEYMSTEQEIAIEKPFVSLRISVDNDSSPTDSIGRFNRPERVEISWFNNISTAVSHGVITAKLSGSAYDKAYVSPEGGLFRSSTNEIIWNQQTDRELASMGAGESGRVYFTITPKDTGTATRPLIDPIIDIEVNVSGSRSQESFVPETLSSVVSKNIKVSSNVSLTGRSVRSTGPFINTGPIPPKAEHSSTYTIVWTVDNTSSSVTNAQVVAVLPAGVKWLGIVSPSEERVSFEPNTGRVTWDIGTINTYTFNSSRRREVAFQISVTPSISDVGQSMTLVGQSVLNAVDSFTGEKLQSVQEYLTTRFGSDPTYKNGYDIVVN